MPKNIKIIEEFDPSLPLIKLNRDLIIQALDNIFINAYESSNFIDSSYLKIQTRFIVGESIKIPNIKKAASIFRFADISYCDIYLQRYLLAY